ncbi:MAG TPA: TIGR00266 family protein [Dongiaceae bacterium]
MQYQLNGTTMQTVEIDLDPGETVYSQTHAVAWMNDRIRMDTHTGGGFFAGLKRRLGGGSFFVTDFTAEGKGHVAFAPRFPGTIIARTLATGESLICRKETFLCAEKSVTLELAFQQRLGAGFFGGEGFILQQVTGPGTVWLDLSGEVVEKDLGPDDVLLVHVGHVGIQTPGIRFDIQMVRGFRNILFGGEGLFLAHLRGPGKIWLQSMPIMILAEEIGRHLPGNTGNSSSDSGSTGASAALGGAVAGGAGAVIGGLLGGLLSGGSSDGDN